MKLTNTTGSFFVQIKESMSSRAASTNIIHSELLTSWAKSEIANVQTKRFQAHRRSKRDIEWRRENAMWGYRTFEGLHVSRHICRSGDSNARITWWRKIIFDYIGNPVCSPIQAIRRRIMEFEDDTNSQWYEVEWLAILG